MMDDPVEAAYRQAKAAYFALLAKYRERLEEGDPDAKSVFIEAEAAWIHLRSFNRDESHADACMHLVVSFTHAVGAKDSAEAYRLYSAMTEKYRAGIDKAESINPGTMKIWSRREKPDGN